MLLLALSALWLALVVQYIYRTLPISGQPASRAGVARLHKRYIVITGCDPGGLGYAVAKLLLVSRHQFDVVATYYTESGNVELEQYAVAADCGHRLHTVQFDLLTQRSIDNGVHIINEVLSKDGNGLYALINNAATHRGWLCEFTSVETYRDVMQVNLFGLIQLTHALLPQLKQYHGTESARILNINSFYGRLSTVSQSSYSASKHALHAYTTALRQEMSPFNIRVVSCYMGTMNTPMMRATEQAMYKTYRAEQNTELRQQYGVQYERCITRATRLMHVLAQKADTYAQQIVDSIIYARYPSAEHVVGMDAILMVYLYPLIPTVIYDWAVLLSVGWPKPCNVR